MASQEDVQIARDLYSELRGVTQELKGQETEISKSRKAFRAFEDVAQKFKLNQEDISKLNDKELKDLSKKLTTQAAIAKQEGQRLINETSIGRQLEDEVKELKDLGVAQENINEYVGQALKMTSNLTEEQKALISASFDEYKVVEDINAELEKELAIREEANRLMGVAGGLLSTLNAFGGQFAKSLKLDQVEADMAKMADGIARGEKSAGLLGGKMKVLGAGAKSAFGGLTETLKDPTVILTAIASSYAKYEQSAREIRQETGVSAAQVSKMANSAGTFNNSLVSAIDAAKTIASLTKQTGLNVAAAFSNETVGAATELSTLAGLSAESTGNMALRAEALGDNLGNAQDQAIAITSEFASTNKGAFTYKGVLEDAGKASSSLALSIKGGQKGLMEAAAGAAALGINLAKAEAIADKLLDFESSIAAELEAELLTGQSLNLEKARTAALNNDIATLTEEIGSNQAIMKAFSSGNRIQQEAIAKSLGMQKDDVAKMIFNQKIAKGMTAEQAGAAAGISKEEANRLSTQQQINTAIEKMTAALSPAIGFFASLLDNSLVLYTTIGLIGTIMAVQIAGSLARSVQSMGALVKGASSLASGGAQAAGGIGSKVSSASGIGGKAASKAAEGVSSAADAAKGAAAPGLGDKIKSFLTGLGDGLKSMAGTKVLQGALNLIPAALGFVAMTAGAIGLAAVALAGNAAGVGLTGLSTGLVTFANAMAAPTPLGPVGLVAPVALALLGASMIPFAYALSIAAPAIEAIGTVIHAAFTGIGVIITAVAGGFVMLMEAITLEKALMLPIAGLGLMSLAAGVVALGSASILALSAAAALTLLGLAMIPLSIGFERMSEANTEGLVQSLSQFSLLAPGLLSTSVSLFALAGGLGAIALAGLAAIPVMTALTGLGTVSTGISEVLGMGGDEETSEGGGNDIIAQKLDKLNQNVTNIISTLKDGGIIIEMNGNELGRSVSMGATNVS